MANNRLTRDTEHAMLGGVCAGIANRLGLDPTIVRVATIVLGLVTLGTTVLVYLALWIIMPAGEATPHRPSRDELTEEVRDAAERVQEAARIMAGAAKQAMDEMSHIQGRRRDVDVSASGASPTEDTASHDATSNAGSSGTSGSAVSPTDPGPADGSEVTPSEPSVSPEIPPAASQPSGSVGGEQNWTPPSPADPAPNAPLGDDERREDGQPQG